MRGVNEWFILRRQGSIRLVRFGDWQNAEKLKLSETEGKTSWVHTRAHPPYIRKYLGEVPVFDKQTSVRIALEEET